MSDEEREMMKAWTEPPPRWLLVAQAAMTFLIALVGAMVVMLQWLILCILTSQFFEPWGVILGGLISILQMLMIFDQDRKAKEACPVPLSSSE